MNIKETVLAFKTKHKEGFTTTEMRTLLKKYPGINKKKYNDALQGITGMMKGTDLITYHTDIITAIRCGMENRNMKPHEFD